ncbi:MAG TPA: DM13 domain-containing protein [Mycobacteriales bacterium]|nr:DM13 domain-containing protein [Mycobacteriales bacterium]
MLPVVVAAVLVAAAITVVFVVFQPQRRFYDTTVREPPPATVVGRDAARVRSGAFRGLAHQASGRAVLLPLTDGSRVLRLEDLDVDNGPDLHLYLATARADGRASAFARDRVDLGRLRGNRGDQNYPVPAGVDTGALRSAVIWCPRFSVGWAVAPLPSP